MSKSSNYLWLDLLKGIAIIAVIIDHLYSYYQNLTIQYHSGFHVSLFILIAGFTSSISIQNKKGVIKLSYILKRLSKIFIPYVIATLIYCLYYGYFDISIVFQKIITFSVAGPFYFVFFYLQLISISYFIFIFVNHHKSIFFDILLFIIFYLLSFLFNKSKIINSFYGGSGFLFGGSFFFLYSLGFFIKKYEKIFCYKFFNLILLFSSLILIIFFEIFGLVSKSWSNPANNWLIIYTLIVFSFVLSFYQLFLAHFNKFLIPITIIGKNSLSVFLYHTLFINIFSQFPLTNNYLILLPLSIYLPLFIPYLQKIFKPTI